MGTQPPNDLTATLRGAWQRFSIEYEPLRPELYRYCRHLTRSPWDAEDLCQDALSRAFVTLSRLNEAPPNPRAWLFRVASNLWVDQSRQRRSAAASLALDEVAEHDPRASREASGTLIGLLSPQERAAVLLKDVFDFTLDETASVLATSVGAIKAALHRGRGKLSEDVEQGSLQPPARGVLDAFCEAFNARDLDRLTQLLLDSATIDIVGTHTDYGPDDARDNALFGMLYGAERLAVADVKGGIEARYMQGVLPRSPRCELRHHRGEPLILMWYAHADGEAVRAINRIEADGAQICRLKNYFFTPDFIAEVCTELGVPFRLNGYRFWISGC